MHLLFKSVFLLLNFALASCNEESSCGCKPDCQALKKTSRLVQDDYCDQPLYLTLAINASRFVGLDNVCYTVAPLMTEGYFVAYSTFTYSNGTKISITYLLHQVSPGYFSTSTTSFIQSQAVLGTVCDTTIQFVCGESEGAVSFPGGLSSKPEQLSECCVQQAKDMFAAQGLSADNLFALPMKLPPDCPVVPTNPFYKYGRCCCPRCNKCY